MALKSTYAVLIVGVLVIAAGASVMWNWWVDRNAWPEGLILANGRLEGDIVTVASKFAGRVQTLLVREGDAVELGQTMVELDDIQVRAQVEQARQAWEALQDRVEATHTDLSVLNLNVPLAIEAADAKIREDEAILKKSLAVEQEAENDFARYRQLLEHDNVSVQQYQEARRKRDVATNEVAAARATLDKAMKDLALAELGWKKIRAKEQEVAALEHERDRAEATFEEAASILADLTITAPSSGILTTRLVDVGEFVSAGAPLFEMVDFDRLYLKAYVPEIQIGKIRLGLPARIHVDAFPEEPFRAVIRYIASRAEFTPKEVQTPDERVKLTYAVKLYLEENPDHKLTPGMPADAVIRWKEDVDWRAPQW